MTEQAKGDGKSPKPCGKKKQAPRWWVYPYVLGVGYVRWLTGRTAESVSLWRKERVRELGHFFFLSASWVKQARHRHSDLHGIWCSWYGWRMLYFAVRSSDWCCTLRVGQDSNVEEPSDSSCKVTVTVPDSKAMEFNIREPYLLCHVIARSFYYWREQHAMAWLQILDIAMRTSLLFNRHGLRGQI